MKISLPLLCYLTTISISLFAQNTNSIESSKRFLQKDERNNIDNPYLYARLEEKKVINNRPHHLYTFHLEKMSLQPGQKFILSTKNCIGGVIKMADAYVDNQQDVIIKLKFHQIPMKKFKHVIGSMCLGESIDIILSSTDREFEVSTHIVMHPIEAISKNGQRISAELRSRDGSVYEIFGEGYCKNEGLKCSNFSEGKGGTSDITADENGTFRFTIMPMVEEFTEGFTKTTVFRKNGESLSIQYPWGISKIKPVNAD